MSDPTYALHIALLERMSDLVDVDVWDAVPNGADYPYVTLDTIEVSNEDMTNNRMERRFAYFNVWSRHPGQAEVLEIMGKMDAINGERLSLSTGHVAHLEVSRKRTSREADNLTFQGRLTLEIITKH